MRGKAQQDGEISDPDRITPAYAGKSLAAAYSSGDSRDHPRLCGEKRFCVVVQSAEHGSPPPMRGKVYRL